MRSPLRNCPVPALQNWSRRKDSSLRRIHLPALARKRDARHILSHGPGRDACRGAHIGYDAGPVILVVDGRAPPPVAGIPPVRLECIGDIDAIRRGVLRGRAPPGLHVREIQLHGFMVAQQEDPVLGILARPGGPAVRALALAVVHFRGQDGGLLLQA